MLFADEPSPGEPLPVLAGHSSPGRLERVLRAGGFAVTASIEPPASAAPAELYIRAHVLDGYVDAYGVDRAAVGRMAGLAAGALLARRGYSVMLGLGEDDLGSERFESEVLAASALGVVNLRCDDCEAAVGALARVRVMRDEERMPDGAALAGGPRVFIGTTVGPGDGDLAHLVERTARLVDAGAQFACLEGFHDLDVLADTVAALRAVGLDERCFMLVGLEPFAWTLPEAHDASDEAAAVPESVLGRLRRSPRPRLEARRMCMEAIQRVRTVAGVSGVHVRAPGNEETVAEIIDASGVLASRVPWYPELVAQPAGHDGGRMQ